MFVTNAGGLPVCDALLCNDQVSQLVVSPIAGISLSSSNLHRQVLPSIFTSPFGGFEFFGSRVGESSGKMAR